MTTITSITNVTATTATINMIDIGADGTTDIQISPRQDFAFCVCPILNFARAAARAVSGLNQRGTYWVRARNRSAAGVVEDWSPIKAFRTADGGAQAVAPAGVMIEPAIFVKPVPIVQVLAINTVQGFPPENMFRDVPVAFRKTANAGNLYWFDVETGGEPVDTFAILNTNIPYGAAWYVQGSDVQIAGAGDILFSSDVQTFPATANLPQRPGYHGIIQLNAPRAYKWWRIVTDSATTMGGVQHIEYCVIGLNRASKNHSVDKTETPQPQTAVDRKRSGMADRVLGIPMRKVDFELSMLTEAQYETIYGDLWRYSNEAVFIVPNSKRGGFFHDRFLYGDLGGGKVTNPSSPLYTVGFSINSLI